VSGRVVIVGHGLVERQVRGPLEAGGSAESVVLQLRRYRCRACRAILVVGPRGVVHRRWYGAGSIALALEAYGRGESSAAIRQRISPSMTVGASAHDRWMTVVRWVEAARTGALFRVAGLGTLGRRAVAEHVALALAARGDHRRGLDLAEATFAGALIAA
jgi:hypothetical protein